MAKVLFIQPEWFEHLGILGLAAAARQSGHQPDILLERRPRKILPYIIETSPDVVAFSATTGAHRAALGLAEAIRPFHPGLIVMGGPHPTFFPEVIDHPALDAICRGEGEIPLCRLLDRVDVGGPVHDLPGLWAKKEGDVIKNDLPPLIADLDTLPFPARDLLDRHPFFKHYSMRRVMAGRGCPYQCAYCFNKAMREMVKGKGPYVRTRGVDNMMAELSAVAAGGARTINFVDDTFGLKWEWTRELLDRYPKEIALPFIVNLRPEQVNDELARALARAGCYCAQIGIESADPRLRREVLGRDVSGEVMEQAVRRCKEQGIRVLTYNMVGIPGETLEQAEITLRWNADRQIDFPRVSIFQPYPRTELGDKISREAGNADSIGESYFRSSPLAGPEARRIEVLHKLSLLYIRRPSLRTAIRTATRLPQNPLFDLAFLASIGLQYRKALNLGYAETIKLGLHSLRAYFD